MTVICNGHSPTDESVRSDFGCNGYVTAVAVGKSLPLYSGVGIFNWHDIWYYLSSSPGSFVHGGLTLNGIH
jgi:hypothetical protein